MKNVILLLLTISVLVSCHEKGDIDKLIPPVDADFVIGNDNCKFPCDVSFINRSEYATNYRWNFGDGRASEETHEINPTHRYREEGTYEVTLVAHGPSGYAAVTKTVTISGTNTVSYFMNYKADGEAVSVMQFSATRDTTGGVNKIIISGTDASGQKPELLIYLEEPTDGFSNGLIADFNETTAPTQEITYMDTSGTVFSTGEDPAGMSVEFTILDYALDGMMEASFSGSVGTSGGETVDITDGTLKLMFDN
ncbi:MAG: PKD domain-containing protein [Bacteroidia bacterium]